MGESTDLSQTGEKTLYGSLAWDFVKIDMNGLELGLSEQSLEDPTIVRGILSKAINHERTDALLLSYIAEAKLRYPFKRECNHYDCHRIHSNTDEYDHTCQMFNTQVNPTLLEPPSQYPEYPLSSSPINSSPHSHPAPSSPLSPYRYMTARDIDSPLPSPRCLCSVSSPKLSISHLKVTTFKDSHESKRSARRGEPSVGRQINPLSRIAQFESQLKQNTF